VKKNDGENVISLLTIAALFQIGAVLLNVLSVLAYQAALSTCRRSKRKSRKSRSVFTQHNTYGLLVKRIPIQCSTSSVWLFSAQRSVRGPNALAIVWRPSTSSWEYERLTGGVYSEGRNLERGLKQGERVVEKMKWDEGMERDR
jgi:hypothetical protein